MSYLIFADVSIDIDKEMAEAYDIKYIPMEYMLGDTLFHCAEPEDDAAMHHYYDELRKKTTTKTSQITPMNYVEAFEPYVKEGKEMIYLCLSSGLSDTYSSACVAVNMLKEEYETVSIEVVDSLGATGGMGLLAEAAGRNRVAGMSFQENAAWLREHAKKTQYWFKVEDLMYLMRGGRVSAATAILGTALNIKPILTVNALGKLDTIDKKRGNKLAVKNMLERFEKTFDPAISKTIYICCADCKPEAESMKAKLLEMHPDLEIRITMLSPIIGAHTGPDMLSLIHFGCER